MALTGRRDLFCREYLIDLNATQAALRAGYSSADAGKEGHRLLADEVVQQHIAELAAARNQKLEIKAETVLLELHRMLVADIAAAFTDEGTLKSIHEIPVDLRRTIASIKVQETFDHVDGEKVWTGYLKEVKFWSKEKAAELLGKHLALFIDRLKVDGLEGLAEALTAGRNRTQQLV